MDPRELKVVSAELGEYDRGEELVITFANNMVKFTLYDIEITDYYEAYTACLNKTEWFGNIIEVYNGIVKISVNTEYGDVYITLPAVSCVNAFKEAYDKLSEMIIE